MKTHVICEKFFASGKLIDRPVGPELWEEETAVKRARMLQSGQVKYAYYARLATAEEIGRAQEIEARQDAGVWQKVG